MVYGLTSEINVENELWHMVKVGGLPLPHPPLVNLTLPTGLPPEQRFKQSFLHEFGHLQTYPVALMHAVTLFFLWTVFARNTGMSIMRLVAGAIANHSAWELFSESFVTRKIGPEYLAADQAGETRVGRTLFWQGMMTLTAIASYIFIRDINPHPNRDK